MRYHPGWACWLGDRTPYRAATEIEKRSKSCTTWPTTWPEVSPAAEDVRVLVFESVRGLLFNVVKHAQTKSATVTVVRAKGDRIRIERDPEANPLAA